MADNNNVYTAVDQAGYDYYGDGTSYSDCWTYPKEKIDELVGDSLNGIETAKQEAIAAVAEEGTTQTGLVEAKGEEVIASIPADYSELSADVSELKSDFTQYYDANSETEITDTEHTLTWTEGSYYKLDTGVLTPFTGYRCSQKINCKPGDVVLITNHRGQILFWKSDGTLASAYASTSYNSTMAFSAPSDAVQYAFNNNTSPCATTVTQKTANSALIETDYIAPAKLLFDSDYFINNKYVSTTNGKIYTGGYSGFYCLAFVPCEANHKYRTESQTQIIFYDASMTFLSALLPNNDPNYTGITVEMDFTTPANCAYMSINSRNTHEKLFDLEPYSVVGNVINPYKLEGKTAVFFGDSITGNYGYGDNYPYQVERLTGAKTYNCGFGGCRMELVEETSDVAFTNPFCMCSIVDALEAAKNGDTHAWDDMDANALTISTRVFLRLQVLKSIDWSKIDIVSIAYGTNEGGYPQDDENDKYNKYTYAGATRYAVEKLLTLYPKLRIVLLTPIYRYYTSSQQDSDTYTNPTYGYKLTDNVETLIKVGKELKIPVIDLYYSLGINITNYTSYFGDDDEQSDGTHINSFGREQFGKRVAGEMNRLF